MPLEAARVAITVIRFWPPSSLIASGVAVSVSSWSSSCSSRVAGTTKLFEFSAVPDNVSFLYASKTLSSTVVIWKVFEPSSALSWMTTSNVLPLPVPSMFTPSVMLKLPSSSSGIFTVRVSADISVVSRVAVTVMVIWSTPSITDSGSTDRVISRCAEASSTLIKLPARANVSMNARL